MVHALSLWLLESAGPQREGVALKVQERVTEHEIWCNGSGNLQPLLD